MALPRVRAVLGASDPPVADPAFMPPAPPEREERERQQEAAQTAAVAEIEKARASARQTDTIEQEWNRRVQAQRRKDTGGATWS